ncbi:MAG: DUF4143 domain-containing protein [archaeon]|nr:DUF4143 domain-containing protein [archaeon]
MSKYWRRYADIELERSLNAFGAVLIEGPKWCGKTTTAEQASGSVLYLQDPDRRAEFSAILKTKPSILLEGDSPRLIDEWQLTTELWDAIRFQIDQRRQKGLFILTGSTSVDESRIQHSGAGRIRRMRMGTLSLAESGDSSCEVFLEDMLEQKDVSGHSDLTIEKLARLIVRGGWPESIGAEDDVVREQISGYCDTLVHSDIQTVDGRRRNPDTMVGILRSISRNISTSIADTKIVADILEKDNYSVHANTVKDYLNALRRLFVLEDLPAWSPKVRSRTTVRTSDTRHLCDPALACHFLGASWRTLLEDFNTFGLLFESLAIRDLRTYASVLGGRIYHYRDSDNLECDAVIVFPDGSWGAMEVKLGSGMVEEAASNLIRLRGKVDTDRHALKFLAVVTGTEFAYRREDGVYVVPLGCLAARGL